MAETPTDPQIEVTIRRLHLKVSYDNAPAGQWWYEPDVQPIIAKYERLSAQQAETIRQLQAEIEDRTFATAKDASLIRRLDGQIATLTEENARLREQESKAWEENRRASDMAIYNLKNRVATLTAALEQRTRWADFLAVHLDENHDAHGSDFAWSMFMEKEHEAPPVSGCECERCCAVLAAAPQGGK